MLTHFLRMGALTAGIVLCTFLPFLPGSYDILAVPLSAMAQMLGAVGLLLVPIGGLWLAYEYRRRRAASGEPSQRQGTYRFAITALIVWTVIWVMMAFGAWLSGSISLGLGALALTTLVVSKTAPRLRSLATTGLAGAMPLYLIVVPVVVAALQFTFASTATEFSRSRAIRNSAPLIADIERYRVARGHYPPSLLSVNKDYKPSVRGIEQYRYEPSGDAYNVFFEQLSFRFGTREFVMYNPLDQQVMTSHAVDLLQLTPAELEPQRGYYAVRVAAFPHWKYFLFD